MPSASNAAQYFLFFLLYIQVFDARDVGSVRHRLGYRLRQLPLSTDAPHTVLKSKSDIICLRTVTLDPSQARPPIATGIILTSRALLMIE